MQWLHDLHGYDRAVDDVPEVHARVVGPVHRWARYLDEEPCWPGWPRPGFGSLPLTLSAVCQPLTVAPSAACAAVLPRGRPGASLTDAVMPSCAVPAWYQPVPIGEVPYVDGALCSPCNADLLAGADLDELYVLAPMASFAPDRPRGPLARLERASRRAATRQTLRELSLVRAAGTRVRLLTPNAFDLHIMGGT